MSFVERKIDLTFVLGEGTFGDTGSNQVKLSGLRISAKINRAGGPAMGTANIDVYGMKLDMMNQLSTLGLLTTTQRRNSILVEAGDVGKTPSIVFQGTITNGWPDLAGVPDVPFRVEAHTGLIEAIAPTAPKSYPNPTDAATILQNIAAQWNNGQGVPFENNGVSVILPSMYLWGPLRNQAWKVVQAAGIIWNGVEDGTLAIWNAGEARKGEAPLIAKGSGLVGYPSFTSTGIRLRSVYNPAIGFGKKINVSSSLNDVLNKSEIKGGVSADKSQSTWVTFDLNHDLSCITPDGPWFTDIQAAPLGLGPMVAGY